MSPNSRQVLLLSLAVALLACNDNAEPAGDGKTGMKTAAIVYVALGDSTGAGVGAVNGGYVARLYKRILEVRPGSQLANFCVSGATTSDVLRGQLDKGIAKDPQLVTLGIGINDIGHSVSLEQFAENYERILSTLKQQTKAQIVVTNIPDVSTARVVPSFLRGKYHQLIVTYNQRLEEIANRYGVTVFDVYSITHRELPSHPEYFSPDGFHPSDKGYELWAVEMWPSVERVVASLG